MFLWSRERYPEKNTENKRPYELDNVKGGLIGFEKRTAQWLPYIWGVALVFAIIACIVQGCKADSNMRRDQHRTIPCSQPSNVGG